MERISLVPSNIIRFKSRVLTQFRSRENIEYLEMMISRSRLSHYDKVLVLATLDSDVYDFSNFYGGGHDAIDSDNISVRSQDGSTLDLWSEVRMLNSLFYKNRLSSVRMHTRETALGDGNSEPYHMRMFIADSLRPPGLSSLNGIGPLHEILENRADEGSSGRFMRYESIPFWQKGGRNGYDLDIEETLGTQTLEMGSHVRKVCPISRKK